ncbi:hypothetical protein GGR52DRAFT_411482 [Hypoxylon sp. FL1284]|nr:hypothetical protein GGR52DRAFT_411482 [Hypoxylon sp. FL1284]
MTSFEPLMSFNLPELLAVDLGESETVFKSRQLTAGPPAPALVDDGSKRRYSLQDKSAPLFRHQDLMSRAQSLQNVHEKQAHIVTIHQLERNNTGDSDSASSESSTALVPLSIDTRDASVVTTATSVASERTEPQNRVKPQPVLRTEKLAGESWMDLDNEDATSPDRRYSSMVNIPPPTQFLTLGADFGESRSLSLNSAVPRPYLASPSTASPTTVKNPGSEEQHSQTKRPFTGPTSFPKRRSSLQYQNYPIPPHINVSSSQLTSNKSLPKQPDACTSSLELDMPSPTSLRTPRHDPNIDNGDGRASSPSEVDVEANETERYSRGDGPRHLEIAPPGVDVESWLESSIDNFPYYARTGAAGGHAPLPLPPEVVDTLRVSIACFPETMLQCSSLSIETIRSHSRKLRYKATGPASLYSESPGSVGSEPAKQSLWKWLSPWKQQQPPSPSVSSFSNQHTAMTMTPPSSRQQRSDFTERQYDSYSASWPRKPDWTAIQNLFPSGSDYLCDALYAHLVAYNYITSLCPRSVLVSAPHQYSRPASKSSTASSDLSLGSLSADLRSNSLELRSTASDGTGIPAKAGKLLGLQDDPSTPIPEPSSLRCNTLRSKRSFFAAAPPKPGFSPYELSSGSAVAITRPTTSSGGFGAAGRRPTPPSSFPPDHNDQLLRDLRLGVARCISRLVTTLRMTNGGGDSGAGLRREEDPDFMRALCEIVRLSEERYM